MVSRQKKNADASITYRKSLARWLAGSASARSRSERSVPPSGSRPAPKPEMGSLLTPKTPTGLPVARRNATACAAAGKPEPLPLRYKSASRHASVNATLRGRPSASSEPSTIRNRGNARTSKSRAP